MTRYCHPCALAQGIVGGPISSNLTGSVYQVEKFIKHTQPSTGSLPVGVFLDPSYSAYAGFVVNSMASGSAEVDSSGRTNIVWYAGRQVGWTWQNGVPVLPNDAVKLVLAYDPIRIHPYSVSSAPWATATCSVCRALVLT
jgi:hypothetical protein